MRQNTVWGHFWFQDLPWYDVYVLEKEFQKNFPLWFSKQITEKRTWKNTLFKGLFWRSYFSTLKHFENETRFSRKNNTRISIWNVCCSLVLIWDQTAKVWRTSWCFKMMVFSQIQPHNSDLFRIFGVSNTLFNTFCDRIIPKKTLESTFDGVFFIVNRTHIDFMVSGQDFRQIYLTLFLGSDS